MIEQIEFKSKPEVKIWEVRRQRLSQAETGPLYIRIGGEIFEVRGRISRKVGEDHASLYHALTGKYFLTEFGSLAVALVRGRIKRLNEMEVIAWVS